MLMAYNLYQEDITRIFNPATGIEVYHNYTLLHDDLQAFQSTFDSVYHDFFRKLEEAYPELNNKDKLL